MNVLVTGGAGYVGSHVSKALACAGLAPVVFDNLSMGHRWAVKWGPLVEGDLADSQSISRAIRQHNIDAVMHLAASAYVGESMTDPRKYFENNTRNTMNLLGSMLDHGVKYIVFSSTCATYGNPTSIPMGESHPQQPVNPYGDSKYFVERMLEWYSQAYSIQYVALRYFNAAGADPDGEIGEVHDPETHLVPLVIEAAQGKRKHLGVFGSDYPTPDGTAVRDYIHVKDLGTAHVLAVKYLQSGGYSMALNLGTGIGHSVLDVVQSVERISGRRVPVVQEPRRPGDPPILVADARKAKEVLDWSPQHSDMDMIVDTAWRWSVQNAAIREE